MAEDKGIYVTFICFYHVNRVLVMLTGLHLYKKSKGVCIKTRSPAASRPAIIKPGNSATTEAEAAILLVSTKVLGMRLLRAFIYK